MLPAARCCCVPLPLHPRATTTIPCRRAPAPAAVSAKPRRRGGRGPRRDSSWDDDGSDADDGFFGDELDIDEEPDQDDEPLTPRRAASPEPPQLRGTDVLRALQRAAAAKAASKKGNKRPAARPRVQGKGKVGEAELAGEARPVVVRPEWAARIRELEVRVRGLADKYHHHL